MNYYIYEIIGDKVGLTTRYPERPLEQGAREGEYKLLETIEASEESPHGSFFGARGREEYWQDKLGYKRDPFNGKTKMKNVFKQYQDSHTITIVKDETRKDDLLDLDELTIESSLGNFTFGNFEVKEFMDILETGPYGGWFVKIKRARNLREELDMHKEIIVTIDDPKPSIKEFDQIREWATNRGLYEKGDPKTQYVKLQEEAGELAKALLKNDEPEIEDGLGDILVVLINLSHLCGYKLEDCLETAYQVINKRTGKMIDGTFVKD